MTKTNFAVFLLIMLSATSCFHNKKRLTVLFDRVDGLTEESSVINKGLTVGKITHLDLFGNRVLVEIQLRDNVRIPVNSTFVIKENLLGSSYIDVEYSNSSNFLTAVDTVYGTFQKQAIMDNIISDTTKRKHIEKSLEKIAEGIGELVESTKDTTKR